MARIEVNGVSLAYDDIGVGDPTLVWVHGGITHRGFWHRYQIPEFSLTHRCVAVDLRGHGESDKPRQAYPIVGFADDLAAMFERLGLDRPVLIGHSLGCAVVLQLAASYPRLARALVLNDGPSLAQADVSRYLPMVNALLDGAAPVEVADSMFTAAGFFLPRHDPEVRAQILATLTTPGYVAGEEIRGLAEWDRDAIKGRIEVPTLHLASATNLCPDDQMLAAVSHAILARTVGAGHFNAWEVPTQVNAMIVEFLREYVD